MEYNNELYHHGVKGMRWGVRLYQRKDGSLTKLGKKRRAKLENKLEKLGGGKKESDGDSGAATRKKSVSEMSNKELQDLTDRMKYEKNYYDAQKNLAESMPQKQVSKGRQVVEKLFDEAIIPSVSNATKAYIEKTLKEKLGIKDETKINWDDMIKKQTYAKNEANKVYEDLKRQNDINQEKDRAEARNKKRAEAESTKSSGNDSPKSSDKSADTSNNTKGKAGDTSNNSNNTKSHEGEKQESKAKAADSVEGVGYNSSAYKSSTQQQTTSNTKKPDIVDAGPYELVPVSSVPAEVTNRGQAYISGLLEEPKGLSRR